MAVSPMDAFGQMSSTFTTDNNEQENNVGFIAVGAIASNIWNFGLDKSSR